MMTRVPRPKLVRVVVHAVAERYGAETSRVYGRTTRAPFVLIRAIVYKLLRDHTDMTLKAISELFGRDHSTVHYGLQMVTQRLERDRTLVAFMKAMSAQFFDDSETAARLTELAIASAKEHEGLKVTGQLGLSTPGGLVRVERCAKEEGQQVSLTLPATSVHLLDQVTELGLWGDTREEVCRRFVDEGLRRLLLGGGKTLTLRVVS